MRVFVAGEFLFLSDSFSWHPNRAQRQKIKIKFVDFFLHFCFFSSNDFFTFCRCHPPATQLFVINAGYFSMINNFRWSEQMVYNMFRRSEMLPYNTFTFLCFSDSESNNAPTIWERRIRQTKYFVNSLFFMHIFLYPLYLFLHYFFHLNLLGNILVYHKIAYEYLPWTCYNNFSIVAYQRSTTLEIFRLMIFYIFLPSGIRVRVIHIFFYNVITCILAIIYTFCFWNIW